jgi:putative membrane protein
MHTFRIDMTKRGAFMDRRTILLAAAVAAASGRAAVAQNNQAPPAAPASSGAAQQIGQAESTYANQTAAIGTASLQMADIAVHKARHPRVREFARFERDEQTTAAKVLKSMDANLNPPNPPSDVAGALERLKQAPPGAAFDREFVAAQIQGHEKLRTIQDDYLKDGKDQPFVNTAQLVLFVINEHLTLLNDLRHDRMTAL